MSWTNSRDAAQLRAASEKDTPIQPATQERGEHTPAVTAPPPASNVPPPPEQVRRSLDAAGLNHRPILLAIDTDVSLAGEPCREWLVVTHDHLSAADEGRVLRTVAWSEVEQVRTVAGVGGGSLQVRCGSAWTDLVRYSNSLATRFHKVSRVLAKARDDLAAGLPVTLPAFDGPLDPPRCPSCSLRLANPEDSCPRCLQKGQILRRVSRLLAPYARGAVVLCLLTLLGVVAELVPPKLQQYMVDEILSARSGTVAGAAGPEIGRAHV